MGVQENTKLSSIKIPGILWLIFSVLITLIGMKLNKVMLSLGIIILVPTIIFLIKVPKRLIYAEIIYVCVIKFLISTFNLPSIANYVTDIINLLAFVIAIGVQIKKKEKLNIKITTWIVIFMIMFSIIGLIKNGQSILLYMWGFRNIYRFFAFMYSSIVLLNKKDVENIFKILNVFFVINIFLCLYQYLGLHQDMDHIGGIFGISSGVNGYMNIYLMVIFTYALTGYLHKTKKLSYLIFIAVLSLFVAVISELKMFFVELIIITLAGILLSNFKKRTFLLVAVASVVLYLGVNALYVIYPAFEDYFTLDNIIESASDDESIGRLTRLTAISEIDDMFLTDNSKKLVGIGMGSAETSQIEAFNTDFFRKYGLTLRYTLFSHAFMLLENGYAGFILYVGFFVAVFYENGKMKKKNNKKAAFTFTQILALISIMLIWYNSSLRTEAAYLTFFALSVGYIYNKSSQKSLEDKELKGVEVKR